MITLSQNKEAVEYSEREIVVGDAVSFKNNKNIYFGIVISINDLKQLVIETDAFDSYVVRNLDEVTKNFLDMGYNPFNESANIQNIDYSIESIINMIGLDKNQPTAEGFVEYMYDNKLGYPVYKANLNPFITIDGETIYYQREFVWEQSRKQKLIDTIYNYGSCGTLLIRADEDGADDDNKPTAWFEIVDGKQRILSLWEFINDKYPDNNGQYFTDLSLRAKRKFLNALCFKVGKIKCTDEEVLRQFVVMNHGGKPQEKEHLDMLQSKIKK